MCKTPSFFNVFYEILNFFNLTIKLYDLSSYFINIFWQYNGVIIPASYAAYSTDMPNQYIQLISGKNSLKHRLAAIIDEILLLDGCADVSIII